MSEEGNYKYTSNIVLIGDKEVGKSNIISKYLKNEFQEVYIPTIRVEFYTKTFNIEGHPIKVQIWDISGQEAYKPIISTYYKGIQGALIVYDITSKKTFDNIDDWIYDLKGLAGKDLKITIIGNKSDLKYKREIMTEKGEKKAKRYEASFIETSALTGENIVMAFENLIMEIYHYFID